MTKPVFTRICPDCNNTITHKNNQSCLLAIKYNRKCRKCAATKSGFLARYANPNNTGPRNNFFGRHHSEATLRILRNKARGKKMGDDFKKKMSILTSGSRNPMFGRTVMDVWIEKYGEDEAQRRRDSCAAKQSARMRGAGNPMYARPSPNGSGNGWSGWYKSWYFRSLRELSFVVKTLEPSNTDWKTGESLRIPYICPTGKQRTYSPDFIVSGTIVVEVKPKKLHNSPSVTAKKIAAEEYCKQHDLTYQLTDQEILSDSEISALHSSKTIVFIERYEKKYQERQLENHDYKRHTGER